MTAATRPVLSDRHRTILAAVRVLGTPSAAAAHLGLTPSGVDGVMARAGVALGVPAREVVRHASNLGLLEDAPATVTTRSRGARKPLPSYPRGDGTLWAPRRAPHIMVWAEGRTLLVLRCVDVEHARQVVAARWEGLHGSPPPTTGQIVWRRPLATATHNGGQQFEPAEPLWPRAFPAVLFTPEGA